MPSEPRRSFMGIPLRKRTIIKFITVDKLSNLACGWTKKRPRNDDENPVTVYNCKLGDMDLEKEYGGFEKLNVLDPIRVVASNIDAEKGTGNILFYIKTGSQCMVRNHGGRFNELECTSISRTK